MAMHSQLIDGAMNGTAFNDNAARLDGLVMGRRDERPAVVAPESFALSFGKFTLHPKRKLLLFGGNPVHLGSRALDLLVALVGKAGQTLGHDELVAKVWPNTVVEASSLRVHISALRRTLGETAGERYILTVPRQGYNFVMPVSSRQPAPAAREYGIGPITPAPKSGNLARLTRVIGRDDVLADLGRKLATQRLVTLVGAGGIGKTTVAAAYLAACGGAYRHGACVVDLSAVNDPTLVAAAIASATGIFLSADDATASICTALCNAHMLVVLDNCEHLIHAVTLVVERLLDATAAVAIVATSREPLYAHGEWVMRLPPLAVPGSTERLGRDEALEYPAVALFVERAMANSASFVPGDDNLSLIAQLCSQLDGIPLAIELAAARVEGLGVEGLAACGDDLPGVLTRGRRTALPRHAAMQAVFDCSYRLLGENERVVLRRLSVFRAGFSLESAASVCVSHDLGAAQVMESVLALVAKSLLAIEAVDGVARYRSLNTTRFFSAAQLARSDDAGMVAKRHACYLLALFDSSARAPGIHHAAGWMAGYGSHTADLMAALDWSFGPGGDAFLGIQLCASVPYEMIEPGMVDACRTRIETALERLGRIGATAPPRCRECADLELRHVSAWA